MIDCILSDSSGKIKLSAWNDEAKKMDDNSGGGSSIELTLWGETAVNFNDTDKILAVRGARFNEFQGRKTLNLGFTGFYSVQPQVACVDELELWAAGLRGSGLPSSLSDNKKEGTDGQYITIREIKEQLAQNRTQSKFSIAATPIKINTDKMFYRAHNPSDGRSCRKGVQAGVTFLLSSSTPAPSKAPTQRWSLS